MAERPCRRPVCRPRQWQRRSSGSVASAIGSILPIHPFCRRRRSETVSSWSCGLRRVNCLGYLENLSTFHLQKQRDRSQVRGWVSYPLPALRETLVNAVYHRGYDVDQPEPTKVYLYPSRVEVISYPGPVPGIESRHLVPDAEIRAAPARNRRIGEFLKELGLAEGRLSGLPKVFKAMEANGSPVPRFDFDEQRTWFQATLPAHPEYAALSALRDAAHLRGLGEHDEAFLRIESAWSSNRASAVLAAEMIRACAERGETRRAEEILEVFEANGP